MFEKIEKASGHVEPAGQTPVNSSEASQVESVRESRDVTHSRGRPERKETRTHGPVAIPD